MKAHVLLSQPGHLALGLIMDRPFVQHLVEQLVQRGIDDPTLLLPTSDSCVRRHLEDGTRWGIAIHYVVTTSGPCWRDLAHTVCDEGGPTLFGNGTNLPCLPPLTSEVGPTLFFETDKETATWSGWGVMSGNAAHQFCARIGDGSGWREAAQTAGVVARKAFLESSAIRSVSEADILASNRIALNGQYPGLYFYGRSIKPGVWIGRGARIDSRASLQAPCYVGEDVRVQAGCTIGPNTTVGKDCVVERGATVARSVLAPGTYVGPDLDLLDSLVDGNRLFNVRLGRDLLVQESHVLSRVFPSFASWFSGSRRVST